MTIVKRVVLCVVIITCICVSLFILTSCSGANYDIFDELGKYETESQEEPRYNIVIRGDASSKVKELANMLSDSIASAGGRDCIVSIDTEDYYDFYYSTYRILLGYTAESSSRMYMLSLNRDDYICKYHGDDLILGGKSDTAVENAVIRLIQNIEIIEDSARRISEENCFLVRHRYEISRAQINGIDIVEYTFVCAGDFKTADAKFVERLRELISNKCGAYPDINYDGKRVGGKREIILSYDNEIEDVIIKVDREDVIILANESCGLSFATLKFYELLFSDVENGEAKISLTEEIFVADKTYYV